MKPYESHWAFFQVLKIFIRSILKVLITWGNGVNLLNQELQKENKIKI